MTFKKPKYERLNMPEIMTGFPPIDFAEIACWAQMELLSVASGRPELHKDFGIMMLCAASLYDNALDVILDGMKNSDFINRFVDIGFISFVIKLFSDTPDQPELHDFCIWLRENGHYEFKYVSHMRSKESRLSRKYRLLSLIDAKFPMILLKHYAANSSMLFSKDVGYVIWLNSRLREKARYSEPFMKLHKVMEKDIKDHENVGKFMS